MNFCGDTEQRAQFAFEFFFFFGYAGHGIRERVNGHFHKHVKGIVIVYSVNHYLIVRRISHFNQNGLYLRREDVDAADYEHIVGSAHRFGHTDKRSAAGTFFVRYRAYISCSETYKWECFFCQAGENYLALRAVGNVFSRFGVYYFNYKIVFVDVHSVLFGAFIRNAGAADLGKAVYVVCFYAETSFYLRTHFLRPRFGSENTRFEFELGNIHALFFHCLRNIQSIRRGAAYNIGLKILDNGYLSCGISA